MIESPIPQPQVAQVDRTRRHYAVNQKLLVITLALFALGTPTAYLWYKHQLGKTALSLLSRAEQLEQENEWSKATAYYQRYLLLKPEDTETLVRMVEAYAKGQSTPRRIARLTRLLYQALGRAPERTDLRLLLAENLLSSNHYEEAEHEAKKLVNLDSDEASMARKIIALSLYARARTNDQEALTTAVSALRAAAEELPGDVRLVAVTADALRQHPTKVKLEEMNPATYADQMMDKLVEANPQMTDALIARYRYRIRYQLPDTAHDLQSALEISPNHVEALLLSANAALVQGKQSQEAETLLRRAIESAPDNPQPYLVLAGILEQAGKSKETLALLRQGHLRTGEQISLGMVLTRSLISANELGEASRVLGKVQSKCNQLLARLEASTRTPIENQLRLLRARLALAQERPLDAASELQAILFVADANPVYKKSTEWLQATGLLAQMAERLEQWDKAATYWENLANIVPKDANIAQASAAADLKIGDAAAAIRRLDDYSQLAEPTAEMMVQLVQAHLMMQLGRPAQNRNWAEFLRVLNRGKTIASDRWELVFAEVDYLLANQPVLSAEADNSTSPAAGENRQSAIEILQAAESTFADQAKFWQGATRAYQMMGREEDTKRSLARYLETESSPINHISLQVALLSTSGKFAEADELLVTLLPSLSESERRQVQRLRVETLTAAKELTTALDLVGTLIDTEPNNTKLLALGIGISLDLGDLETAEKWEAALGQQETDQFDWRYLRSLRLLRSYDTLNTADKNELASLISKLRSQRPRWYPIVALAAGHAQLNGDLPQALADYRLAVELGDHRTSTLERLVSLLYKHDRLDEAEAYLTQLRSEQPDNPAFDSLAIQAAVKQNRLGDALELAKQGVEQYPDDTMRHLLLANLMLQNGQTQEAIQVFSQAAKRFPNDPQVWKGLVTLFVNTGRVENARATLSALLANQAVPDVSRHLVAAQGFELLGDLAEAKQHYQSALTKQPENIDARLRYARLLQASSTQEAHDQYEKAFLLAPNNGEVRRGLASLLAATGREEDWSRAQQLLKQQTGDTRGSSVNNDRVRAMLLSRQGRTRQQRLANCQAARDILQQLLRNNSGDETGDLNRRLLASIYEQEADLGKDNSALYAAREQLRYLVDRKSPSPDNLILYLEFLLRHAVTDLVTAENDQVAASPQENNHALRDAFLTEAEARLQDLKRAQENSPDALMSTLSIANLTVRILHARERDEEASQYVAQFIESQLNENPGQNAKTRLLLMTGDLYAALGQHSEAEKWYRQLMQIAPRAYVKVVRSLVDQGKRQEAAQLCLNLADGDPTPEVAIILTQIMTTAADITEEMPAVRAAIEAVVASHNENIDLLQAMAVMKASHGEYDEAITTFRRLIEIDPGNALAMNNLATLLAEHPNQLAEALEYIERAMGIVGRSAGLLDTQGTIFIKQGDPVQAIACLEEATAGGATDARYYFHLAAAYHLANRIEEANSALQSSRKLGLESTVLTNDDRRLLALLDQELAQQAITTGGGNL